MTGLLAMSRLRDFQRLKSYRAGRADARRTGVLPFRGVRDRIGGRVAWVNAAGLPRRMRRKLPRGVYPCGRRIHVHTGKRRGRRFAAAAAYSRATLAHATPGSAREKCHGPPSEGCVTESAATYPSPERERRVAVVPCGLCRSSTGPTRRWRLGLGSKEPAGHGQGLPPRRFRHGPVTARVVT